MKRTFFYLVCFIFLAWMTSCHRPLPLETDAPFIDIEPPDAPAHSAPQSGQKPPLSGQKPSISPTVTPIVPPASSLLLQSNRGLLPAPLYALSGKAQQQQIWRLERMVKRFGD